MYRAGFPHQSSKIHSRYSNAPGSVLLPGSSTHTSYWWQLHRGKCKPSYGAFRTFWNRYCSYTLPQEVCWAKDAVQPGRTSATPRRLYSQTWQLFGVNRQNRNTQKDLTHQLGIWRTQRWRGNGRREETEWDEEPVPVSRCDNGLGNPGVGLRGAATVPSKLMSCRCWAAPGSQRVPLGQKDFTTLFYKRLGSRGRFQHTF